MATWDFFAAIHDVVVLAESNEDHYLYEDKKWLMYREGAKTAKRLIRILEAKE